LKGRFDLVLMVTSSFMTLAAEHLIYRLRKTTTVMLTFFIKAGNLYVAEKIGIR